MNENNTLLIDEDKLQNINNELGEDISYELAKIEYEHCIRRSEKLDNKIYILLTVCAVLIGTFLNTIYDLLNNSLKINAGNLSIIEFILFIFCGVVLALIVITTCLLIFSLRKIDINRFTPEDILIKNMLSEKKARVARYACIIYVKCSKANHDIIDKRYKTTNVAVVLMGVSFVLGIILRVVIYFYEVNLNG